MVRAAQITAAPRQRGDHDLDRRDLRQHPQAVRGEPGRARRTGRARARPAGPARRRRRAGADRARAARRRGPQRQRDRRPGRRGGLRHRHRSRPGPHGHADDLGDRAAGAGRDAASGGGAPAGRRRPGGVRSTAWARRAGRPDRPRARVRVARRLRDRGPGGPARRRATGDLPRRPGGPHQHAQARRAGSAGDGVGRLRSARGGHARDRRRPRRGRRGERGRARADRHAGKDRDVRRIGAGRAACRRRLPGGRPASRGPGDVSIRVLLVDDQELMRTGFRMVLGAQQDIDIVGEAADGAAALEVVKQVNPDVVLMDVRMPRMDGVEATRRMCALPDSPRVLILTTFDLDEYAFAALRAGASGFLLKDVPPAELVSAIRSVHSGDAVVAPSTTRRLLDRFAVHLPDEVAARNLDVLTIREREVLQHVARGMSNSEIAGTLHLAEATVKTHIGRILAKLGLRDRAQAVVAAYENGLVKPRN
ncbi:response regulator transcription factor [Streptosporangiaceae bacterium NEAU-GS5]|nr:response regulator transcription factor [Streptosporangiaceae bacterium NEAU-GS5]